MGATWHDAIMDAHNLAWQLVLVASGRAPEQLLDSYGQERAPVAAQVLRLTHALVRFDTKSHPLKRGLRDAIVSAAGHIPAVQRRAARRLTQVHVADPSSGLTRPDRRPGKPRPGQRAPDIEVLAAHGHTRLHSVLRRGRHVLLIAGADPAMTLGSAAIRPYRHLLEAVADGSGHSRAIHDGRRGSVLLVRPAGYIAARGMPGKMAAIESYLRQLSADTGITAGQRPVSVEPTPDGTAVT
jgi:FAD binding domain/Aromatic-ring hydroxylase, C-terminal